MFLLFHKRRYNLGFWKKKIRHKQTAVMFPCFHNVNKARVRYFRAEKLAVNIITFCKTTDECRNENTKALHEQLNIQQVPRCLIDCQLCKTRPFSRIHHSTTGKQNAWFGGLTALTIYNTVIRLWSRVYRLAHWRGKQFLPKRSQISTRTPDKKNKFSSGSLLISTEDLEYGGNRFLRNYDKFLTHPWNWRRRFLRNYGKFLQETSETMENSYQKPEMAGRNFSEMLVNFWHWNSFY